MLAAMRLYLEITGIFLRGALPTLIPSNHLRTRRDQPNLRHRLQTARQQTALKACIIVSYAENLGQLDLGAARSCRLAPWSSLPNDIFPIDHLPLLIADDD